MKIKQIVGVAIVAVGCSLSSVYAAGAGGNGSGGSNGSGAGPSGADVSGGGGNNPAVGAMAASGPAMHSSTVKKSTHKSTKKSMSGGSGNSADQAKGGG